MDRLIEKIEEVRKVFLLDFVSAVWYDTDKEIKDRGCLFLIEPGNLPCLRKIIDIVDIIQRRETISLVCLLKLIRESVCLEGFL